MNFIVAIIIQPRNVCYFILGILYGNRDWQYTVGVLEKHKMVGALLAKYAFPTFRTSTGNRTPLKRFIVIG